MIIMGFMKQLYFLGHHPALECPFIDSHTSLEGISITGLYQWTETAKTKDIQGWRTPTNCGLLSLVARLRHS